MSTQIITEINQITQEIQNLLQQMDALISNKDKELLEAIKKADKLSLQLYLITTQAVKTRSLQKEYFRTRSRDILIESKQAEKQLDQLLGI